MTATASPTLLTDRPEFLDGIVLVHDAIRRDVVRLPAAIDRLVDDDGAWALVRWFAKFERQVEHHHHREDDVVWPMLLDRAPEFACSLNRLEADHWVLDRAMSSTRAAVGALTGGELELARPGATQSAMLLRDLVLDHLDREEALMFPVAARTFTPESWAELEDELLKATPKRLIAFELPFAFDGTDPEWAAEQMADLPLLLRILYRLVWEPAYRRLTAPLAHADIPAPVGEPFAAVVDFA